MASRRRRFSLSILAALLAPFPSGLGLSHTAAASGLAPYPTAVLADNPLIYYRLDESSGPVAADLSGNLQNGTYAASGITYGVSGALISDSDTAISVNGLAAVTQSGRTLPSAPPLSIEVWMRTSSTSGGVLWSFGSGAPYDTNLSIQYGTIGGGNNPPRWNLDANGGQQSSGVLSRNIFDNNWHQFVVTIDPSGALVVYLDGATIGSGGFTWSTGIPGGGLALGSNNGGGNPYSGGLDEFSIYSSVLGPEEVSKHWTLGESRAGTACATTSNTPYANAVRADSPLIYYPLDDLNADAQTRVAFDQSGNCHNGSYAPGLASQSSGAVVGGTAVTLPGTGGSIMANDQTLPSAPPLSVEIWARTTANGTLWAYGSGSPYDTHVLIQQCCLNGEPFWRLDADGGQLIASTLPAAAFDGNWHQYVFTEDAAANVVFYMDGSAIGTGHAPWSTGIPGSGLELGNDNLNRHGNDTVPFAGDLGQFSIYNTVLGAQDVASQFNAATKPPPGPTIQSISPAWASFVGGTPVMIKGNNFGAYPTVAFTDNCAVSVYFYKTVTPTNVSPAGDSITVMAPSADSPGNSDGLYNVGLMHGPGCIKVTTADGSVSAAFTWVVPEIGILVSHNAGEPFTSGQFNGCTAEAVSSNNHLVVLTAGHCVLAPPQDDFAFAPGYFGADIAKCSAPPNLVGSSAAFYCGTTPYGIWCEMSPAIDTLCGPTNGRTYTSPRCCADPTYDFAFLTVGPSLSTGCPQNPAITALGNCIGGGLAITWHPAKTPGGAAKQSWNLFGYNPSFGPYLDTCTADPTMISISGFGTPAAGWLGVHPAGPKAPSGSVCPWFAGGNSGGPWINGQNLALYGVGALNKGFWGQNQDGIAGTYLGDDAKANWRLASTATVASVG